MLYRVYVEYVLLSHTRFLPNTFQLKIHQLSNHKSLSYKQRCKITHKRNKTLLSRV